MRRAVIFVAVGLVVLAALFLGMRPGGQSPGHGALASVHDGDARTFRFDWRDGRRVSGPDAVRVGVGTRITLALVPDRDDVLHIHGHDRHAGIAADRTIRVSLRADKAGRFPAELHGAGRVLTTLEISPR